MRWAILATLLVGLFTQSVWANAPELSVRPIARANTTSLGAASDTVRARSVETQPRPRPVGNLVKAPVPERIILVASASAVARSIRPLVRPENLKRRNVVQASGMRTQPDAIITKGSKGSVCGISGIKGVKLAPIPGRIKGCGVADPVQIVSVDGVALSTPATMDCRTAQALNSWIVKGAKPNIGRLGGGIAGLKVVSHYACRTRNNQKGAKISEHGRGRAIDISAIILKNGASMTVLKGWRDPDQGKVLRAMHRSACGTFGTVLGPNANKFHQDHFHFDTARYRSGSYCR